MDTSHGYLSLREFNHHTEDRERVVAGAARGTAWDRVGPPETTWDHAGPHGTPGTLLGPILSEQLVLNYLWEIH